MIPDSNLPYLSNLELIAELVALRKKHNEALHLIHDFMECNCVQSYVCAKCKIETAML